MAIPFASGRPLPLEILENIAFELVASSPLGNPAQLLPLLATSKAVNNALAMDRGTALYSRICRLKFDVGAVTRRAFTPLTRDLNGHLIQMCNMLKFFASGDIFHEDAPDQLLIAYVAMLENDGKNRAQLEHVGIVDFVDRFIRQRLHEGKENNDGWPKEDGGRVYAMWLMWFFSTRERLMAETEEERAQMLRLVFPFLVCPNRYTSAIAPPNHFSLPLDPDSPAQNHIFVVDTAHGSYPVYHTARAPASRLYHFSAQPVFMEPLIAPVAGLLFWSRRELNGVFQIPPHLPQDRAARQGQPGLTQVDLHEFNATRVAKLPERVVWDWVVGTAVKDGDGGTTTASVSDPSSARFDADWWRARLCTGILTKQPKFRLGSVYLRGMMAGLWQGIMFVSVPISSGLPAANISPLKGQSHTSFMDILRRRQCSPTLSENSTYFTSKPLWMRATEHGFIRTSISNEFSAIPQAPAEEVPITITTETGTQPTFVPVNVSFGNAWFPGPVGSVRWLNGGEPLDDGLVQDKYLDPIASGSDMGTTQFIVSQRSPFGSNFSSNLSSEYGGPVDKAVATMIEGDRFVYEHFEKGKISVHQRMVKAKGSLVSTSTAGGDPKMHCGCPRCQEIESLVGTRKARDREGKDDVELIFETVGMEKGPGASELDFLDDVLLDEGELGARRVVDLGLHLQPSHHPEVQEDIASTSHIGSRQTDGESSSRAVPVSSTPPYESFGRQNSPSASVSSHSTLESDDEDSDMTEGEDDEYPEEDCLACYPEDTVRRSHDPYRVEECDDGVEDVVLTGELDESHRLAWGETIYYGRVRPWDGMIAILALSKDRITGMNNHIIYYGYIYGGDVFAGNWRYATMDPLVPTIECGFIMSKKSEPSRRP